MVRTANTRSPGAIPPLCIHGHGKREWRRLQSSSFTLEVIGSYPRLQIAQRGACDEIPLTSICRRPSRPLLARTGCLGLAIACSVLALGPFNVLERSYNKSRTGANTSETILTPAKIRSSANLFHKQFVMRVDGKIEGSPLYASAVTIAGGTHNVVYVATMHNTVYAFDADNGTQLAARWLGTPITGFDLGVLKPVTIHSEFGIVSTPVIDPATGTLYVVRWGYENGISGPTYRLFGLDLSDLTHDKFGSVLVDGYNVGGAGFNRYRQIQRAGLVLALKPSGAKAVVIAFGGGEGQGTASG
jgi:hypothetical protein